MLERGCVGLTERPKCGRVEACEGRYWDTLGYLLVGMLQGLFVPLDLDHPRPILINSVARLFNRSNPLILLSFAFLPENREKSSLCAVHSKDSVAGAFFFFFLLEESARSSSWNRPELNAQA